jgi:tRNA (mo5U34)-methyltransferase
VKNPYLQLELGSWPELAQLAWQRLESNTHGDMPRWLEAINKLPEGDGYTQLDLDAPMLGQPVENIALLSKLLTGLHPWRKGPLDLAV